MTRILHHLSIIFSYYFAGNKFNIKPYFMQCPKRGEYCVKGKGQKQ
jgi:hypothetical protein